MNRYTIKAIHGGSSTWLRSHRKIYISFADGAAPQDQAPPLPYDQTPPGPGTPLDQTPQDQAPPPRD